MSGNRTRTPWRALTLGIALALTVTLATPATGMNAASDDHGHDHDDHTSRAGIASNEHTPGPPNAHTPQPGPRDPDAIVTTTPSASHAGQAPASHPILGYSTATISELETTSEHTGIQPGILGVYADFTDPFPTRWATEAARRNVPLLIAWEPWDSTRGYTDQPEYSLSRIADGAYDEYARTFASAAHDSTARIIIRFAPEMNGDWQVWNQGDTPADFVAAWQHLHDLFTRTGATDIQWAFTPVNPWAGSTPYASYWPGKAYVDWVGVDGYTWQTVLPGRTYQTPSQVFDDALLQLTALAGEQTPLVIAETGSAPGRKSDWIRSMITYVPRHGIDAVVWFERKKETDWRLSTSKLGRKIAALLADAHWRIRRDTPGQPG